MHQKMAGYRLGALGEGGGVYLPPPLPMHPGGASSTQLQLGLHMRVQGSMVPRGRHRAGTRSRDHPTPWACDVGRPLRGPYAGPAALRAPCPGTYTRAVDRLRVSLSTSTRTFRSRASLCRR